MVFATRMALKLVGVLIAAGASLGLLGCGGGDDETTTAAPTTAPTPDDIVDLAEKTASLSELVRALKAAGLVEELRKTPTEGYTVFAPQDGAWDEAAKKMITDAATVPAEKTKLANILKFHVVKPKTLSTELKVGDLPTLYEVSGAAKKLPVANNGEFVLGSNEAKVTGADKTASNGVVHIIDKILDSKLITVVDLVDATTTLSQLKLALETTGLDQTLATTPEEGFTVFAPEDDAWDATARQLITDAPNDEDKMTKLTNILLYHVVKPRTASSALKIGTLTTEYAISGTAQTLPVAELGGEFVFGSNEANVTAADNMADNGVAHIINEILELPDGSGLMTV